MSWYVDLAIVLPALVIGLAAQWWVRSIIAEADFVPSTRALAARAVAERLLMIAGVSGVTVETSDGGEMDDHYDGRSKVIRLSDPSSTSVAGLAIAAHEVGHAVQESERAVAFRLRSVFAPVAAVASVGWLVLIFIGVFFGIVGLIHLAVMLFGAVAAFHLVTLPVEIGASRRAMAMVRAGGLVTVEEERIVRRVLRAAAMTYLATALISIVQIIGFLGEE